MISESTAFGLATIFVFVVLPFLIGLLIHLAKDTIRKCRMNHAEYVRDVTDEIFL